MTNQIDRVDNMGPPAAAADSLQLSDVQPDFETGARKPAKRKSITTMTLTDDTCKWPIGDPATSDFHYCGRLPQSGRPYCDKHYSMSRQSTKGKNRSENAFVPD